MQMVRLAEGVPEDLAAHGVEGNKPIKFVDGDLSEVDHGQILLSQIVEGGLTVGVPLFRLGTMTSIDVRGPVSGRMSVRRTGTAYRRALLKVSVDEAKVCGDLTVIDDAESHASASVYVRKSVGLNVFVHFRGQTAFTGVKVEIKGSSPEQVSVLGLPSRVTCDGKTLHILVDPGLDAKVKENLLNCRIQAEMAKHPDCCR